MLNVFIATTYRKYMHTSKSSQKKGKEMEKQTMFIQMIDVVVVVG